VGHSALLSQASKKAGGSMIPYMEEEDEPEVKPSPINIAAMQMIVDEVMKQFDLDKAETKQEVSADVITVKLGEHAAIKWLQRLLPKKKKDTQA
jgi:hypothetical protein